MSSFLYSLKKLYAKSLMIFSVALQELFRTTNRQNFFMAKTLVMNQVHRETFGEYKNKYNGREIAILATGPTLNQYKPIEGAIHIGVNRAFLQDIVPLDYYFAFDYSAVKNFINEIGDEKYKDVKKFYGICPENLIDCREKDQRTHVIPESIAIRHNAKRFYTYSYRNAHYFKTTFHHEIDKSWLTDGGSIALIAAQFALFTNPKKIYLVGCDCSNGYFDKSKSPRPLNYLVKFWKDFKDFASIYYPETEIVSVNPVGLKGIFNDLYQLEESNEYVS